MIYLVGIAHSYQRYDGEHDEKANQLKQYAEEIIVDKDILTLAEEYIEDLLKEDSETVLQKISNEHAELTHQFCEMSINERKAQGIKYYAEIRNDVWLREDRIPSDDEVEKTQRSFFPTREQYWLNCLKKHLGTNILFFCGADHLINSFPKLLDQNKIAYKILIKDFDDYHP